MPLLKHKFLEYSIVVNVRQGERESARSVLTHTTHIHTQIHRHTHTHTNTHTYKDLALELGGALEVAESFQSALQGFAPC
jgi:hypothetical protein